MYYLNTLQDTLCFLLHYHTQRVTANRKGPLTGEFTVLVVVLFYNQQRADEPHRNSHYSMMWPLRLFTVRMI